MEKRRIFVFCKHLLFAQALQSIIGEEEGLEVVGMETDGPRAMESIRLLKPEIVVVETGEEGIPLANLLPHLFRQRPGTRMIGLSMTENEITVYHGQQRQVRRAEDLLEVIWEM